MTKGKMVNAYDASAAPPADALTRALLERRSRLLGPSYRLFYEDPVHVVGGEGVWLIGPHGEKYLDVYNNVPVVGHGHPAVVRAVSEQMARLNTHTRYLNEVVLDYAEDLLSTFPAALSNVIFTCTGSEACDLALRIAKAHTGGNGIIVTANAYHGVTEQVALASPSLGIPLGPHVRTVPAPDAYRQGSEDVGRLFAAAVKDAIADLTEHGFRPAALIADTIFSSDGILPYPPGFLKETVDALHAAGALFIADEVQPGFARLGDFMWGFMRHGVVPDLVVMGKPMGNGIPIGAVAGKPEVLEKFGQSARYFNTFGGNPVSCAAAQATLCVIRDERLMENARETGQYLQQALAGLAKETPSIGEVRGAGLFIGVDFVVPGTRMQNQTLALFAVNALRRKRILISASGPEGNVLKIRPPLPFARAHCDMLVNELAEVLRSDAFKRLEAA